MPNQGSKILKRLLGDGRATYHAARYFSDTITILDRESEMYY